MKEMTIHEFEFTLINEFFTDLERQGSGSPEETIRALSFIGNLSNKARIADLDCGTGFQTMVLAQNTEAIITALDLYTGSIDKLNATVKKLGLQDRVEGIVGSKDSVPEIGTIAHNISIMQKTGYIPVAAFTLPESYWVDNYFIPQ